MQGDAFADDCFLVCRLRDLSRHFDETYETFAGGYYTIELAGSRIRLVALNMNLYMEDIMDEMKFRRTHLRRSRNGGRGRVLKGEQDPSLEAVTDPDPMGQWARLSNVMETARKKQQNVRLVNSMKLLLSERIK